MLPINICMYLAAKSYQIFYNLIEAHCCTDLLTDKGLQENKVPDFFLNDIERLIIDFNKLYEKNKIKISDIITDVYHENDLSFFEIKNLKVKLHYYIARALLPKNTYRILADITDHYIACDSSLTIISIANCSAIPDEEIKPINKGVFK